MKKIVFLGIIIGILWCLAVSPVSAMSQKVVSFDQTRPTHVRCFLIGQINNFTVDGDVLIFHAVRVRGWSWTFFGIEGVYIFRDMNVRVTLNGSSVYYSPVYMMGLFSSTPVVVS